MNSNFIPVAEPNIGEMEERALLAAFRSGWISSSGEYLNEFERSFARFCNVDYAVAVSNGTVAIHLALLALGIGRDDEVIVPTLTFVASAAAVVHAGATPVFVDSEAEIGTACAAAVKRAITRKTKAIIAVHLYGHPAAMRELHEVAAAAGVPIVEDAAEAHGARCNGEVAGSMSTVATFSFYGNKILTTGEGGMVVTNDRGLAEKVRFFKDHAMDRARRYWHPAVGYNYRMTNLQAAIGVAQLHRFAELSAARQHVIDAYREAMKPMPEILVNPRRSWAEPVPWLATAILPQGSSAADRDALIAHLREDGIDSRPFFYSVAQMPPYVDAPRFSAEGSELLVAQGLSARGINLPTSHKLGDDDIERIAARVMGFF